MRKYLGFICISILFFLGLYVFYDKKPEVNVIDAASLGIQSPDQAMNQIQSGALKGHYFLYPNIKINNAYFKSLVSIEGQDMRIADVYDTIFAREDIDLCLKNAFQVLVNSGVASSIIAFWKHAYNPQYGGGRHPVEFYGDAVWGQRISNAWGSGSSLLQHLEAVPMVSDTVKVNFKAALLQRFQNQIKGSVDFQKGIPNYLDLGNFSPEDINCSGKVFKVGYERYYYYFDFDKNSKMIGHTADIFRLLHEITAAEFVFVQDKDWKKGLYGIIDDSYDLVGIYGNTSQGKLKLFQAGQLYENIPRYLVVPEQHYQAIASMLKGTRSAQERALKLSASPWVYVAFKQYGADKYFLSQGSEYWQSILENKQ